MLKLVQTMDEHEVNAVLSYYYILHQNSTLEVEPDEWEQQVIKNWEAMTEEEKLDGSMTQEEIMKEFDLA